MDNSFDWLDYAVFAFTTLATIAIVAYYALIKKPSTVKEYIWGKGDLGLFPLTMSIIATNLSSLAVSEATDVYMYGVSVVPTVLGILCLMFYSLVQIPVLYPLKLASLNEYAALRFDFKVKLAISVVLMIQMVIHSTLICYTTGLFIGQIIGVNYFVIFISMFVSCYILTIAGGFAGVVWTDTLQGLVMFVSFILLVIMGYLKTGNASEIIQRASSSGRLSFDLSLDPTHRLTLWNALFLPLIDRSSICTLFSPLIYQRFAAFQTESQAKKAAVLQSLGTAAMKCLIFILGYIMYAAYHGCDPVREGKVEKYDQIIAYFVDDVGRSARLVRSVYIIGFICAAVSTLTTILNTFAVIFYKDFLETPLNPKKCEKRGKNLIKLAGLAHCMVCTVLIQMIENSGTVYEMISLMGVPMMAHAAVYTMGMFMPCIDSTSAFWGMFLGSAPVMWLAYKGRMIHAQGLISFPVKDMLVDACPINSTISDMRTFANDENVFILYRISPFILPSLAFVAVIAIAFLLRSLRNPKAERIDPKLISPWVHRFLPSTRHLDVEEKVSLRINESA